MQAIQDLRDEMNQLHGRQSLRLERLADDVNGGFEKIRTEMRVQNGRVNDLENRTTAMEEGIKPISRGFYAMVALMMAALLIALIGLVVKP